MVVAIAIGLRPNRSINGPMKSEPIGSEIVTKDAGIVYFSLAFCLVHFDKILHLSMLLRLVLHEHRLSDLAAAVEEWLSRTC